MQVLLQDKNSTKDIVTNLGSAALISFILVLPFALLESLFNVVNKQKAFALTVLFGLLWLLTIAFIVILVPIVRTVRAGNNIMANPLNLLFRVVFLTLIAMMLGGILIDQLPCFLGVPNCD
jgi:undecaprenyl pyrophosphate phosphatase UppP